MKWEELTGDQFPGAVKKADGVCLLPFSCLERHGHHLPVGTDFYIADEVCRRASEIEPVIIFPNFIYTQILEARHYPGCIGIQPDIMLQLIDNVLSEIARNDLKKIIIVNAHGGNDSLIHFIAQTQLAHPRDFVVYVAEPVYSACEDAALKAQWESKVDGHAGESETSAIQAIRPDLVDQAAIPSDGEGMPLDRLRGLRELGVDTAVWWYADHPTHYCGDGSLATREKGERMLSSRASALATIIRRVKQDTETLRLQDEFFSRL